MMRSEEEVRSRRRWPVKNKPKSMRHAHKPICVPSKHWGEEFDQEKMKILWLWVKTLCVRMSVCLCVSVHVCVLVCVWERGSQNTHSEQWQTHTWLQRLKSHSVKLSRENLEQQLVVWTQEKHDVAIDVETVWVWLTERSHFVYTWGIFPALDPEKVMSHFWFG